MSISQEPSKKMHPKYFNLVHNDNCLAPITRLDRLGELPPNVTH